MDDNALERADILKDGFLNSFDVVKLKRIILENRLLTYHYEKQQNWR